MCQNTLKNKLIIFGSLAVAIGWSLIDQSQWLVHV